VLNKTQGEFSVMDTTILIIIAIVAAIGVAIWYANRKQPDFDLNNDDQVDLQDAKLAVQNTVSAVKSAADINQDGKVDIEDVKAAVTVAKTKAKAAAKKTAVRAKAVVKKATTGQKGK
jgi:hypothetical protein